MDGIKHGARRRRMEFGDFQTPHELARSVCHHLARTISPPGTIIEPACGLGSFLFAAADTFPQASRIIGVDVNRDYIAQAKRSSQRRADRQRLQLHCKDSLQLDWGSLICQMPQPWLVIGNPPWVTNSSLGKLASANLPAKRNVDSHPGIEAKTGKSNFDISEFMLRQMVCVLGGQNASLAMLCKTSVARKLLQFARQRNIPISKSRVYRIDAAAEFAASVEACLLLCEFHAPPRDSKAASRSRREPSPTAVYDSISAPSPTTRIGWHHDTLIADVDLFQRRQHLYAADGEPSMKWRSGVKHDCAMVLELTERDGKFWNKLGERVDIESDHVYPFLKSSDVAAGKVVPPRHWLIVPQRALGEDTSCLARTAPRTWRYLLSHADRLDHRRSSVYRRRPRFSVFGIGDYSFAPWKVAISGFYKKLQFTAIGGYRGKPILVDDTCYFVPLRGRREARRLADALNSDAVREFFSAQIFWDAKRPITADLLRSLRTLEGVSV